MTRPELHALVDIVMDARERGEDIHLNIRQEISFYHIGVRYLTSIDYHTFSDFTQAVQDYIKTSEG